MQATDLDQAPTPIVCLPVDFDLQTCVSLHLPFLCFVIEHVLVITNTPTVHSVPSCHMHLLARVGERVRYVMALAQQTSLNAFSLNRI